ncbi:TOMM precursor leader peptide-binding protein [Umezawaea tangerina]|uniref:Ribosomal protein S12 methylthiotransferase accessory factor n=1 Tax=Umezawaea tangerina TaxID=84725 RepID=A0A2T0T767_9PSEU|nr:TOMM precursor leader peptide-binding protein [Umezawaea tangerina]PRY41519.1 ribosomal protein S12 methylthiotransferase accessory factor [Umezawaea tangerina]
MTGPHIGFKRHLRAEVVPGDAVYVFSEEDTTALRGPHLEELAPLLDGTRDLARLRRDLPASAEPEHVAGLLTELAEAGLVALRPTGEPDIDHSTSAYWDSVGVAPATLNRVSLTAVGVDLGPAADALRSAGLSLVDEDADLSVVLCDDYLAASLSDVDEQHRAEVRPWLLAKTVGTRVWLGPVFTPGDGPCWHCLATRLWANRPAEAHVRDSLGLAHAVARPAVAFGPLTAVALNLVALEAAKWLAGLRHDGQRTLWTFDSRDLTGRRHEVRARPQCASCGDTELVRERTRRPVLLRSRPKTHTSGGGHRSATPQEVLDTYRHLVSPLTGVVKDISQDRRGPAFFNSFRSGPNTALGNRGAAHLRSALRSQNGGKGVTPLHAEVGALCEALERHSGHADGDEERVRGSFRSLRDRAIHPDTVQLFDRRQQHDRARWNAEHSGFQYVCAPFDEDAEFDWTPVWSLTRQRHRLLPTAMLYFTTAPHEQFTADSNGNAAGSSLEDAVLQGMLEVVERDAVALWWYNRTRQPAVDLDAVDDGWIAQARRVHAELGREVWALDLTSDIGVPTVVALSRRTDQPRQDVMMGFGAHLDPAVAVRRALTELNQMMPSVIDGRGWDDADFRRWLEQATVENQPHLLPDPALGTPAPVDLSSPDLLDDVRTVHKRLEEAGLEVFVLDQTRPDIGLPVVKVIVPGLRGFWARFAPGRLYDVPVRLGRLTTPTAYEDLNPMPMFL